MNSIPPFYHVIFFAGALGLALILTPLVKRLALATGRVAIPRENRWHRKETALLGGVSIFAATLTTWITAALFVGWSFYGSPYLPMILCSAGIFGLGLADDILDMDPQHKLAGQIVIASVLVFFGFQLGWTGSKTLNVFLSILWIVGITNAFNLLDNMDGLSAGIAFIGGAFLIVWHWQSAQDSVQSAAILLFTASYVGALLGFLVYNFNPASIFMGDAGSLFIGFVLACLTANGGPDLIQGGSFVHLVSVIAVPILIVFIPILDTGFVSFMRKLFRRRISQGGQDHSSHRLVAIGFSERKAVLVLYGFSVLSGLVALAVNYLAIWTSLLIIVFFLLFVLFFWIYLAKVKVYQEESLLSENAPGLLTPVLVEITYRRRLFEVFLDFVLITVAYYTAYLLRFEGAIGDNFPFFLNSLPIVISSQILWLYLTGVYQGVWESTGLTDLIGYIKGVSAGTVMAILILLFIYRFESFSRAVFGIYWVLMLIMLSMSRLSFRMADEGFLRRKQKGVPALIYGAGAGGLMTLREIENKKGLGLDLKGFIDDNPRIYRRKIKGYPILGGHDKLEKIIEQHSIQKIIISFQDRGIEKKKEIRTLCLRMGAEIEVVRMRVVME
ncbi:MAG: hypothetical protein V2J25_13570 [Desulfatiglans sp.]|jgi:UDP-GlcNAc:undecaprenyl-phosphate GlcNAc-1-phosphate transferase|nr:glycosyl transferase [Thermodesulfobacteriota bacterium]MEE4353884.1 hypothetical protein [Desulfatiglans sp.]